MEERPGAHHSAYIPRGQRMHLDQVSLRSAAAPADPTDGVITRAWELVKRKPVETCFLSFLSLIFGEGGCSGGSSNMDSTDTSSSNDWDSSSGSLLDSIGDSIASVSDHLHLYAGNGVGGVDFTSLGDSLTGGVNFNAGMLFAVFGIVALILALIVTFMVVIGGLVRGVSNIYWLRLARGQDDNLGRCGEVKHFWANLVLGSLAQFGVFLPVVLGAILLIAGPMVLMTNVLKMPEIFGIGYAVFAGLIVLGVVLFISAGLCMQSFLIVDKNLGPVQSLQASWRLTQDYRAEIILLFIQQTVLNILGVLCCCVGLIPANAVRMGSLALTYSRIAIPGNAYLGANEHHAVGDVFV